MIHLAPSLPFHTLFSWTGCKNALGRMSETLGTRAELEGGGGAISFFVHIKVKREKRGSSLFATTEGEKLQSLDNEQGRLKVSSTPLSARQTALAKLDLLAN